ncbi:hypothetical protein C3H52_08680 [Campylobacter jejuni]|uniref:hypothetical protein n=1 Tax=Campylobacter jejuni TaxID=197 RepID=UPI000F80DCDD|nr:hypothetical protein [Campylobacter jejuni]RTJ76978.1 hypothetical protein C3H52_08680 [Campylobacter jejuni]
MGEDITFSIFWGLVGFIFRLVTIDTILYITALSVLIAFSILNYWMRINIKEFVKSYFLISFIIFFMAIVIIFYLTYDLETSRGLVLLGPPEIEELSPQEYKVHGYFGFLFFTSIGFCTITFFIPPCLLQAYLFKCYSTGEKRKKLSWFIGFVCNPILITSMYVIYENL